MYMEKVISCHCIRLNTLRVTKDFRQQSQHKDAVCCDNTSNQYFLKAIWQHKSWYSFILWVCVTHVVMCLSTQGHDFWQLANTCAYIYCLYNITTPLLILWHFYWYHVTLDDLMTQSLTSFIPRHIFWHHDTIITTHVLISWQLLKILWHHYWPYDTIIDPMTQVLTL